MFLGERYGFVTIGSAACREEPGFVCELTDLCCKIVRVKVHCEQWEQKSVNVPTWFDLKW